MAKQRIISEVDNIEDARKVEETVKTGYAEPLAESLLNWMGVEEDLASSYEALARKPEYASSRELFARLAAESRKNVTALSAARDVIEGLDADRVKRIDLLKKLQS